MTPKVRQIVLRALSAAEDNLYRFKLAARGTDPSKEWGDSGSTLQELIRQNQAEVDELKREFS